MPDLSLSVSPPRTAAIKHPVGEIVGRPGDIEGQLSVMRGVLKSTEDINTPGGVIYLPSSWQPDAVRQTNLHTQPPPITRYLIRHPWDVPKFISRDVPNKFIVD